MTTDEIIAEVHRIADELERVAAALDENLGAVESVIRRGQLCQIRQAAHDLMHKLRRVKAQR